MISLKFELLYSFASGSLPGRAPAIGPTLEIEESGNTEMLSSTATLAWMFEPPTLPRSCHCLQSVTVQQFPLAKTFQLPDLAISLLWAEWQMFNSFRLSFVTLARFESAASI